MATKNQPQLRLVTIDGISVASKAGGYRSGRSSCLGTPVNASMASTRSAGTRPVDIQRDTLPWDLNPSPRASALWPPTASHALRTTSLDISSFNAQIVNNVNACRANQLTQTTRVSRKSEKEPCPFWTRLVEAWGAQGLPTTQNGVAEYFGMTGNGSTGRWFRGDGLPEVTRLIKIAEEGRVTVDWLLTGRLPKRPIPPDSEVYELMRLWGQLSAERRAHVLRGAEGQLAVQRQYENDVVEKTARKASR